MSTVSLVARPRVKPRRPVWHTLIAIGSVFATIYVHEPVRAHANDAAVGPSVPSARARVWSLSGGFTAHDFSNPGLHAGAEYALVTTPQFRSVAAVIFQAYREPQVETGYALYVRWGQRYTAGFGLTFDSYIGLGVQYTRWETAVFEFRDAVGHARERLKTGIALAPQVVFGPGYDFERALGWPLHVYARPGVTLLYPDLNGVFQVSVLAELGLRWTLP